MWWSGQWNAGEWLAGDWLAAESDGNWFSGKWFAGEWSAGDWFAAGVTPVSSWFAGQWFAGQWFTGKWFAAGPSITGVHDYTGSGGLVFGERTGKWDRSFRKHNQFDRLRPYMRNPVRV